MKVFKKLLKKLKRPSRVLICIAVLLTAIFFTGATVALSYNVHGGAVYFMYFLGTVCLGYVIYIVVLKSIHLIRKIIIWADKYPQTRRFVRDYNFRTMVFAAGSFLINSAYVAFNLFVGIRSRQSWYIALAAYYLVLSITRGSIVARTRKVERANLSESDKLDKNFSIYRATGIMLLIFTAALNVILWLMINYPGVGFSYRKTLIIVVAAYTLIKIIMAVYNIVKARKKDNYAVRAVRNINLASALVSLLSLQTALLSIYYDGDYTRATAGLGTMICAFTIVLGVWMIVKSTKYFKGKAHYNFAINESTASDDEEDDEEDEIDLQTDF